MNDHLRGPDRGIGEVVLRRCTNDRNVSGGDQNRITLIERWESLAALGRHLNAPHMKAFGPRLKDLREGVSLRVTESVV